MLLFSRKGLQIISILLLELFAFSRSRPASSDASQYSDLEDWLWSIFNGHRTTTTTTTTTKSSPVLSIAHAVDDGIKINNFNESNLIYADNCECGVPERLARRVVGGSRTTIEKYPWLTGIQFYGMEYCEGTLISDRHILTAAHCLKRIPGVKDLTLRLGSTRRAQRSVILKAKTLFRHPNYKPTNTLSDIAIIELEDPVEFEGTLRPICLPSPSWSLDGEFGTVAGWGAKKEGGFPSRELIEVQLPVVETERCRKVFADVHDVYDTNICAGGVEGKDACQGDSGGPLMMEREHTYYCIGLVSWGIGCARKELPGVYTRIQSYIDWIHNVTSSARHCRRPVNIPSAL